MYVHLKIEVVTLQDDHLGAVRLAALLFLLIIRKLVIIDFTLRRAEYKDSVFCQSFKFRESERDNTVLRNEGAFEPVSLIDIQSG